MQVVLYLRGVGTSGLHAEVLIEGATGLGIDENIRSAYMFIAQNYVPGDEIFLFGFSRGAYTARSLAGFVGACGILKRQSLGEIGKAWTYYRNRSLHHSPQEFVRLNQSDSHTDVQIKFLGVWDTVGALGIPGQLLAGLNHALYGFHDTGPCPVVRHGCHALAIDEHRDEFVPTLWTGAPPPGVRIEQVWFAGAHADVGGGYVTRKLADIPLVWMAKKAEEEGLALDWNCLPEPNGLDPKSPTHNSSVGLLLKDRLRPTYREILEKPISVFFYERLYAPMDASANPIPTINHKIHKSVCETVLQGSFRLLRRYKWRLHRSNLPAQKFVAVLRNRQNFEDGCTDCRLTARQEGFVRLSDHVFDMIALTLHHAPRKENQNAKRVSTSLLTPIAHDISGKSCISATARPIDSRSVAPPGIKALLPIEQRCAQLRNTLFFLPKGCSDTLFAERMFGYGFSQRRDPSGTWARFPEAGRQLTLHGRA